MYNLLVSCLKIFHTFSILDNGPTFQLNFTPRPFFSHNVKSKQVFLSSNNNGQYLSNTAKHMTFSSQPPFNIGFMVPSVTDEETEP